MQEALVASAVARVFDRPFSSERTSFFFVFFLGDLVYAVDDG